MKVTLINLSARDYHFRGTGIIGVNTLAGYLRAKRSGAEIDVLSMQRMLGHENYGTDVKARYGNVMRRIPELLAETKPDIVGLSVKWNMLETASYIADRIRTTLPGTLVVTGNSLATFGGRELMSRPEFKGTLAVEGEGEAALLRIIETAQGHPDEANNASLYRSTPNVRTGPDDKMVYEALDLVQYPLLDEISAPELFAVEPEQSVPLEFSRGCPWNLCTFCSIKELYKTPEWRPFALPHMMDMIERYVRKGATSFYSIDSEFFGGMKDGQFDASMDRVEAIARELIEMREVRGWPVSITKFSARIDTIFKAGEDAKNKRRLEIYRLLKRAGFKKVYLGLEAGSDPLLKLYGKGVTAAENKEALRRLSEEVGMPYEPGFIFAVPDSTVEQERENLGFIGETHLYDTGARLFGALRLQAGSPLARRYIARGLASPKLDLDSVSYPVTGYSDPQVGRTMAMFEAWEEQTRALIKYLHNSVKSRGPDGQGVIDRTWRNRLSQMDFELMSRCFKEDSRGFKTILWEQSGLLASAIWEITNSFTGAQLIDAGGRFGQVLAEAAESNLRFQRSIESL